MDDVTGNDRIAPELANLMQQVAACYRCQDVSWTHLLSPANGPTHAPVMLIGEAPGRLGAAVSGVPFAGDASGRRLDRLLSVAGMERSDVFITNAVLCNPLNGRRLNRRPTAAEVRRCSPWLQAQIDLVSPRLIVTLGVVALAALRLIEDHPYRLRDCVGALLPWRGTLLTPLYHPSPQNNGWRTWQQQEDDFRRLGRAIAYLKIQQVALDR